MIKNYSIYSLLISTILTFSTASDTKIKTATNPNIVFIFADDMGYGDVQALNLEKGKIKTPHMDQLVAQGMSFTDAHTSSSVCTPSRYSLMTGRYSWRSQLQSFVLMGYGKPLIPDSRLTVASLLKNHGYNTSMIGKWHIGLEFGQDAKGKDKRSINWKNKITSGPHSLGFDYFYGISASLDMDPYIYIENDSFVGECTTEKAFHRKGPAHADFEAVEVLDILAEKSIEYINKQSAEKPFFTYIPLPSPHTPIVPTKKWQGKSGINNYADFMMQTDDFVGQIVKALDDNNFSENTIVIVSSDNGCSPRANFATLAEHGHFPSAQFRGSKADLWDGGHRVPFIVKWPAAVKAGSTSDEIICLTDFMATSAELAGAQLPDNAGEDSVSFLPALLGKEIQTERKGVIHHSISGHFAYREGKWKLMLAKASGGWTYPKENQVDKGSPIAQLYDMEADSGETNNLYLQEPEIAAQLLAQLEAYVFAGRSTPGGESINDIKTINLWKSGAK